MKDFFGWAGKILQLNLSEGNYSILQTKDYSDHFLGGLGIGEKMYWDDSSPNLEAFHPNNPLIFMTGPLAATPTPSASRISICGKSPSIYPEMFSHASLGGFFAAELKKAGYDGIVLKGKADKPVYINIEDEKVEIKDASHLWGQINSKTRQIIRQEIGGNPSLLSIGPGGEYGSRIGTVFSDNAGSASVGFGSVMGSKNVKAIAVKGSGVIPVADRKRMELIRKKYQAMTGKGYHHIREVQLISPESGITVVKKMRCHGCPRGCYRTLWRTPVGAEGIRKCVSANFYKMWDMKLHGYQTEATFQATKLVNEYSLCAIDLSSILLWLDICFKQNILSERETGLPLSDIGSIEFLETVIKKICLREGFGEVLAEGALRASKIYGEESQEITKIFLTQTGRIGAAYSPKIFSLTSLIYATEPRPFIAELHEVQEPLTKWAMWYQSQNGESYVSTEVLRKISERFWGSEKAVDFSTHEDKALAVIKIQNRHYAKESMILCDFTWPIFDDASKDDHVGDPTIESQLLSAVIGSEIYEKGLEEIGERIFNLNRAILLREGRKGREDDYLPEFYFIEREEPAADNFVRLNPELLLPGKGNEVISRKGKAVDRIEFERIRDEYYELRGWDIQTGLLKAASLNNLDLTGVVEDLSRRELVV